MVCLLWILAHRFNCTVLPQADIDILCLLAEVHTAAGDLGEASHCLSRAHDMQRTVVDRSRGSTGGSVLPLELSRSAAICRQAAFCSINDEGSQQWFSEALASDEADEGALAGLARLCLKKRDLEGCKKYAAALLRVNEGSEEGTMLLGEAMFLESEVREIPALSLLLLRTGLTYIPDRSD
jgi:hypothetical protein